MTTKTKTKFKEYLEALRQDKEGLTAFRDFLASPFFTRKTELAIFFEECLWAYKTQNVLAPVRQEELWQKVFHSAYSRSRYRRVCMELTGMIDQFFQHYRLREDTDKRPITMTQLWLPELEKRGLDHYFYAKWDQIREEALQDQYSYFYRYLIEEKEYGKRAVVQSVAKPANLDSIFDNLHCFYLTNVLRHGCEAVIKASNTILREAVLTRLHNSLPLPLAAKDLADPLIDLYYQVYLMIQEPRPKLRKKRFKKTWKKYLALEPKLKKIEAQNIITYLQNYCTLNVNQRGGLPDKIVIFFEKKLFQIYFRRLEDRSLIVKGVLAKANLKNAVTLALRLGSPEKARQIIDDYHAYLDQEYRNSIYHLNLAHLKFYLKDYPGCNRELCQIDKFQDAFDKLAAFMLEIKARSVLGDCDIAKRKIEACIRFVQRSEALPEFRKESLQTRLRHLRSFNNICRYLKTDDGKHPETAVRKIERLKIEMSQESPFLDRDFILAYLAKFSATIT